MKLHIAGYESGRIGGGWSFADNLAAGLQDSLCSEQEADIILVPGATMVDRGHIQDLKLQGKKIVLRVDNHLLPSRNRNTGMQKLKDFAMIADLIIYQSWWAYDYLNGIIQPPTDTPKEVILNGVNLDLFKPIDQDNEYCIYARSSRIAEKGWEMARYWYSRNLKEKDLNTLTIVGKFSSENLDYNFDFYNEEPFRFLGVIKRETFATLLGQTKYFLYSYFMDACSNTLIEALASGCTIVDVYGMLETGGAPEIMKAFEVNGRDYLGVQRMCSEYKLAMEQL